MSAEPTAAAGSRISPTEGKADAPARIESPVVTPASAPRRAPVVATPAVASGPPPLPAPFRNHFLRKYGGELADPHLFARFAVRYKGAGETILTRAWPLVGATAAEILDAEAFDLEVEELTVEAPPGVRYADLPGFFVAAGAKGVERALKDRLPDKLAATVLEDPVSGESSIPGERSRRLRRAPGAERWWSGCREAQTEAREETDGAHCPARGVALPLPGEVGRPRRRRARQHRAAHRPEA